MDAYRTRLVLLEQRGLSRIHEIFTPLERFAPACGKKRAIGARRVPILQPSLYISYVRRLKVTRPLEVLWMGRALLRGLPEDLREMEEIPCRTLRKLCIGSGRQMLSLFRRSARPVFHMYVYANVDAVSFQ